MISHLLAHKNSLIHSSAPFRLPILDRQCMPVGALRLINCELAADATVLADLTHWRRIYMRFFFTHFEPSAERTHRWLIDNALPSTDRLFFLLETVPGLFVGNFGLSNVCATSAELDNLIRGRRGGGPDFIYFSECALLWWLFADVDRKTVTLRVFSNNIMTIALHLSVGFSTTASEPIFIHPAGADYGYTLHSGCTPADFAYDEMTISRDRFFECNPWVIAAYRTLPSVIHGELK
jgi:hypothetical protein